MTKRPTVTELAERVQRLERDQPLCQLLDDPYQPGYGTCRRALEPGHLCIYDQLRASIGGSAENEDTGWHACDVSSDDLFGLTSDLDGAPDDPLDRIDALEYDLRSEIHDLEEQVPGPDYFDELRDDIDRLTARFMAFVEATCSVSPEREHEINRLTATREEHPTMSPVLPAPPGTWAVTVDPDGDQPTVDLHAIVAWEDHGGVWRELVVDPTGGLMRLDACIDPPFRVPEHSNDLDRVVGAVLRDHLRTAIVEAATAGARYEIEGDGPAADGYRQIAARGPHAWAGIVVDSLGVWRCDNDDAVNAATWCEHLVGCVRGEVAVNYSADAFRLLGFTPPAAGRSRDAQGAQQAGGRS